MSTQLPDKCPICGSYLFSDDDIVYCPDCGAPHHRDCWNAVGHCGLLKDHGTENEYTPHEPKDGAELKDDAFNKTAAQSAENDAFRNRAQDPEDDDFERQNEEAQEGMHVCASCGRMIPDNAQFCPYCGRAENEADDLESPFGFFQNIRMDPYGGVNKNSSIEGVSVRKIAKFVSYAPNRMLPLFKQFESGKKRTSWNWAAFLSPFTQCFFRKMNLQSFLYFLVDLVGCVLLSPFYNTVLNIDFPVNTTSQQMTAMLLNNPLKYFTADTMILAGLGLLVLLSVRIFAGLYNNFIYKKHVISTIKAVEKDLDVDEEDELLRKGGTRPFLSLLIFMIILYFGNYIPAFIARLLFS